MKNKVSVLIAVLIAVYFCANNSYAQNTNNKAKQTGVVSVKSVYTCPMHPEVTSDKTGKCPKCGMDLVKKEQQTETLAYTCPMHKEVISDKPGKCSKCGMNLVKQVKQVDKSGQTGCSHSDGKSLKSKKCPKCGMDMGKSCTGDKKSLKHGCTDMK